MLFLLFVGMFGVLVFVVVVVCCVAPLVLLFPVFSGVAVVWLCCVCCYSVRSFRCSFRCDCHLNHTSFPRSHTLSAEWVASTMLISVVVLPRVVMDRKIPWSAVLVQGPRGDPNTTGQVETSD